MIKNLCFSFFLVLVSVSSAFSQVKAPSPYYLDWKKETPLLATGLGFTLSSLALENQLNPRTEDDLATLSISRMFSLDKDATDNYSTSADRASDWFLRGSLFLPLALMADADIRSDAGKISVLFSETMLLTNGMTSVTKRLVHRNRPYVFNENVPIEDRLSASSQLSFFSGHTSTVAGLSFFTAKVWSDYHPESKWKPFVWTAAASIPAVTGYLRYKAGKHYFTDVATGYAVGALVGYLVPHFHKIDKRSKRKFRVSSAMIGETPVFYAKYRF